MLPWREEVRGRSLRRKGRYYRLLRRRAAPMVALIGWQRWTRCSLIFWIPCWMIRFLCRLFWISKWIPRALLRRMNCLQHWERKCPSSTCNMPQPSSSSSGSNHAALKTPKPHLKSSAKQMTTFKASFETLFCRPGSQNFSKSISFSSKEQEIGNLKEAGLTTHANCCQNSLGF